MNKYLKTFLHRGLIFAGFGPIILGIIYAILENNIETFSLNGIQILIAILSIYMLAFLQAGASVFNQIEHWSIPKSMLCHFSVIYLAYIFTYLLNNWIPFDINVILIFTLIFIVVYLLIWLTVYISIKLISNRLNKKIA
ncbi:MAG: DUF3021 domain-containing protein [Clostridia bacterium]|nr:DUF3021 domain-containing protein [Clostridia bacterium]